MSLWKLIGYTLLASLLILAIAMLASPQKTVTVIQDNSGIEILRLHSEVSSAGKHVYQATNTNDFMVVVRVIAGGERVILRLDRAEKGKFVLYGAHANKYLEVYKDGNILWGGRRF